jgi:SAM-dependent methyltransferase
MEKADRNVAAAKHFNDTAVHWTERYLAHYKLSPAFLIRRAAVAWQLNELRQGRECTRALDLGCGAGPYLPLLSAMAKEVVGMDIAPAMLEEVKQNLPKEITNVTVHQGSALATGFPDDHFDIGVCVGVVEYFDDPLAVMNEVRRIMMPGGYLVTTVPNLIGLRRLTGLPRTIPIMVPPSWKIAVGAGWDRLRGKTPDPSRYYLGATFTEARVRRLAEEAGLEIGYMMTSGYSDPRIFGFPSPEPIAQGVGRFAEERRQQFPWRAIGDNLIFALRKPAR